MTNEYMSAIIAGVGAVAVGVGAYAVVGMAGGGVADTHKIKPICDLKDQTLQLEDGSRIFKPSDLGDKVPTVKEAEANLVPSPHPGELATLYDAIRRGVKVSESGLALGKRDGDSYSWLTYEEVIKKSGEIAAGLLQYGLEPKKAFVGLYSKNRPEWVLTEHACYSQSMVVVALYDTLGPVSCIHIIDQCQIELLVVEDVQKAKGILDNKSENSASDDAKMKSLRVLVVIDLPEDNQELLDQAKKVGVEVISLNKLAEEGALRVVKEKTEDAPPAPSDLATINYTSGTTGLPKGVMLTHANIVSDLTALSLIKHVNITSQDTYLSFLPLAHMFERTMQGATLASGGAIGFYGGDIRKLTEDLKILSPTVMAVVPRVLNRIYDKTMSELGKKGFFAKFLFKWGLSSKTKELNRSVVRNDGIWDKLIFKKISDGFGGRMKVMLTGSAPLAENILTFTRAALGCVVLEGYGQTECVAAATLTVEGDHKPGHVGVPLPCCRIKLGDVPDMNLKASDEGRGEILIKGLNVSQGYFKDPKKTADAFDSDGWLHTGDIGEWTPEGTLKIVDRIKHIFKLAQGEYIAPEKIENVCVESRYISQIFVDGLTVESTLVAIVVPDFEIFRQEAVISELRLEKPPAGDGADFDAWATKTFADERIVKVILDDMTSLGKKAKLASFEQPKQIHISLEAFSEQNDLLTPTLKAKRPQLRARYADEIKKLYGRE